MSTAPEDEHYSAGSKRSSGAASYARPNISSLLPDYSNHQAETIRSAFVSNSFRSIQSLGSTPGTDLAPFRAGQGGSSTFSDFVYECSPYDLKDEQAVHERFAHEEKVGAIAGDQRFFAGCNTFKTKFEDYAFEFMSDPYDGYREHVRQLKYISESKCLSTPFVPPGTQKALERPTRALFADVISILAKSIGSDWPEAQPTVLSSAEDLIIVYFSTERTKNMRAVATYMNNALRRNEVMLQYDLRKVPEGWDLPTDDQHYMFTLRPPWVRSRQFLPKDFKQNA
jgi:hypothetical protein